MDMAHSLWEENANIQRVKLFESCTHQEETNYLKERNGYPCCGGKLNFATAACSEDETEYGSFKKGKSGRQDPLSHRIIEKRRRDRMNNCLADLSRLIPKEYLKKGRGRIEKTEIIEMAIKHLQYLQQQHENPSDHFRLGYQECMSETMRFMVEVEGHFPRETMCLRLLNHLQKHCETLSETPAVPQTTSTNGISYEIRESIERSKSQSELLTKREVNNNKASDEKSANLPESEMYEKHCDINGVSYKYKTDIKLRFSQDLNSVERSAQSRNGKKRRSSFTSTDNQSSNHSSPPSDFYSRNSSESDNTTQCISPVESAIILNNRNLRSVASSRNEDFQEYGNNLKMQNNSVNTKSNFNVPVFVLHTKGSFYVPLTLDYKTLQPHLQNYELLDVLPNLHNIVLHPVTINVNFQPHYAVKCTNSYKMENNY